MKATRFLLLVSFSLLSLVVRVGAQSTTFKDHFDIPVNYQTNGVVGTIWDGIYLGAGEFANPSSVGSAPGTASVTDASITGNGVLTVASLQTDWENAAD